MSLRDRVLRLLEREGGEASLNWIRGHLSDANNAAVRAELDALVADGVVATRRVRKRTLYRTL